MHLGFDPNAIRERFSALHASGSFVMPNPHDLGTARLLFALGFPALATTSSGFAATLGRRDMHVSRDELVAHVASIAAATPLPVNVDSEQCFPEDAGGVARTVAMLADAGASGCSIEDWDPRTSSIVDLDVAVQRVHQAAEVAEANGMVLTARCEMVLRQRGDVAEAIERLCRFRDAGAHCVYAPGLRDPVDIRRVVERTGVPVNVLLLPGGPTASELARLGVRRCSTGGWLAGVAFGAVAAAATALRDDGSVAPTPTIERDVAARAFAR